MNIKDNQDRERKPADEIDLGDFLRLIGHGFTKIGKGISWLFVSLYNLVIAFLIFLKRKFAWVLVGLVAGLAIGFFIQIKDGPVYSSIMITRSNFESNYFVYNQINYFNSLIKNKRFKQLAEEFKISEKDGNDLKSFSISPVKNSIEVAKLFRENFLQSKRNHQFGFDTIWSKTIRFDVYKKSLTDLDYPMQSITVNSRNADLFPKIQEAILRIVNQNPELAERKKLLQDIRLQEVQIIESSLQNIDTLRQVYNKKLSQQTMQTGGNQFILGERDNRNPELDLYDKSMILKDELIELKMKSAGEKNILELYSGFGKTGSKQSRFEVLSNYLIYSLLITIGILLLIEFLKFLNHTEKKHINSV